MKNPPKLTFKDEDKETRARLTKDKEEAVSDLFFFNQVSIPLGIIRIRVLAINHKFMFYSELVSVPKVSDLELL